MNQARSRFTRCGDQQPQDTFHVFLLARGDLEDIVTSLRELLARADQGTAVTPGAQEAGQALSHAALVSQQQPSAPTFPLATPGPPRSQYDPRLGAARPLAWIRCSPGDVVGLVPPVWQPTTRQAFDLRGR